MAEFDLTLIVPRGEYFVANMPSVTVHLRDCRNVENYSELNSFVILKRRSPDTKIIFIGLDTTIDNESMILWGINRNDLSVSLTFYDAQWHIIS